MITILIILAVIIIYIQLHKKNRDDYMNQNGFLK
jgi:hypothetical protein